MGSMGGDGRRAVCGTGARQAASATAPSRPGEAPITSRSTVDTAGDVAEADDLHGDSGGTHRPSSPARISTTSAR